MVRDPAENMLLWSPDILEAGPSLSRALPEFMVRAIPLFPLFFSPLSSLFLFLPRLMWC